MNNAPTVAPVPLALPLLDHQTAGLLFALHHKGSYLAHDMGTGKTATAIGWAAALVAAGEGPVLIVVPPSLRTNWAYREIPRFAPHLTVKMLQGTKPHTPPKADIYVMGNMSAHAWADTLIGVASNDEAEIDLNESPQNSAPIVKAIVIDEAHIAKDRKAKRTKALTRIANACGPYRLLLSGTPAPNGRNLELYSQIDILGDDAWRAIGGKGQFLDYYCPKAGGRDKRANNNTLGLHKAITGSWFQRVLRDEVLDLPHKGRSAIAVTAAGKACRDYIKVENDLISWLAEEGRDFRGALRAEALVKLTTLRRLAGKAKVTGTIEHVKDILNEQTGGVLIIAEHKDVMESYIRRLSRYKPVSVRGGMTDAQKQHAVDAFNSGESRVLIGQVTSAGVGLTLHGDGKNHRVIIAELPWTPAALNQAEDRVHRIGQISEVSVEIMLAHIEGRWTIDERLWGMLENKYFDAKELVDGSGEFMLEELQDSLIESYR